MAGVFRSKSCLQCRARKKRCDRLRPSCSACQGNGVPCAYPRRPDVTFVHHTANRNLKADKQPDTDHITVITTYDQSFARSARSERLQEAFWSAFLPLGEGNSTLATSFAVAPRIVGLQNLTNDPRSPGRVALDACILTNLGRRNDDHALMQQGMQMYGKAMSRIQRELRSLSYGSRMSLIPSCRLLCLYEMMRPPSKNPLSSQGHDWTKHARAACHLMSELRSPECMYSALCDEVARLAFRDNLTHRRYSRYACEKNPTTTDVDILRDLRSLIRRYMATLPFLLQQSDELLQAQSEDSSPQSPTEHAKAVESLVDCFLDLDRSLRHWESLVLAAHDEDQSSIRISESLQSLGIQVGADLESISRSHGYGFLLAANEYWATRLVISFQVQRLMARYGYEPADYPPDLQQNVWPYLSNIAHSAPILLSPEAGLYISEQSVYPIATTIHTLAALGGLKSKEMKLIKKTIAEAKGAAFTYDFLKSTAAASIADDLRGDMDNGEDAIRIGLNWYG